MFLDLMEVRQALNVGAEAFGRAMMKRLVVVALAFVAASCASMGDVADSSPDPDVIRIAESRLDPVCGGALSTFDRYYAPSRFEGRDVIIGRFVERPLVSLRRLTSTRIAGVRGAYATTEENLPACTDRQRWHGCSIVHLTLDAITGDFVSRQPPQDGLSLVIICYTVT